jgi:hypothetical protein
MAPRFPGYDEALHQAVSAAFLGPRAENFSYLVKTLNTVLTEQFKARQGYFPDDPKFISEAVQDSDAFKGGCYFGESLRVALMVFNSANAQARRWCSRLSQGALDASYSVLEPSL